MLDVWTISNSNQIPLKIFRAVRRNSQRASSSATQWESNIYFLLAVDSIRRSLSWHHLIFNVNKIKIIKTDSPSCHRAAVTVCPTTMCLSLWRPKSSLKKPNRKLIQTCSRAARFSHECSWIQLHRNRIHWTSYLISYMNETIVCAQTWFWLAKCLFRSHDIVFETVPEWRYVDGVRGRATCLLMTLNYIQIDWLWIIKPE